jgi:hypothetical protein
MIRYQNVLKEITRVVGSLEVLLVMMIWVSEWMVQAVGFCCGGIDQAGNESRVLLMRMILSLF